MVYVIKMTGEQDEYNPEKVRRSCLRAGASIEDADRIVAEVSSKVYEGMTTDKLFRIVKSLLSEGGEHVAARYNLKEAVSNMDPECFEFEFFIKRLFERCGYKTEHSPVPKICGHCVDHEIDVVAEKDGEIAIIECKHHFKSHTYTGLDVPMRQWARLEDIKDASANCEFGAIPATSAWVVTNTKYSEHAIDYARCKGMKLFGWNYPSGSGLNDTIESHKAYPLAITPLQQWVRAKLVQEKIYDVLDFRNTPMEALKRFGLKEKEINECNALIQKLIG